jgi:TetR/AcrR family transcriptional regulator, multidrug resistance operon repressor
MSKRKQIMQVALELFIEQGFHGTSVQMIADRASIAAGSLYRYFQGKEDLIRQIYRMSVQMMVEKLFANVQLTEVNFSTYRQMWLNACFGIQSHNPVILFKDLYERSPFLTAEDRVWAQACWQPLDDFYQSGIDCGLFHALKEQMAAASWKAILAEPLDQPGSNK